MAIPEQGKKMEKKEHTQKVTQSDSNYYTELQQIGKNFRNYNSTESNDKKSLDMKKTSKIVLLIGMSSVNFFSSTCMSLLGPFFPGEAIRKGASPTVIGLIFGTYPFMISAFSPIFGYYISSIGVKFMFISGTMVCGACTFLFGFVDKCPDGTIYIVMCFLCRTIEGIGAAGFMTAHFVIIAHQFQDNIGKAYSVLEMCFALGLMTGPPVGGALYQLGGFPLPFCVVGGFVMVNCLFCAMFLPSITDITKTKDRKLTDRMRNPSFLAAGFSLFVAVFCVAFYEPVLEPHLRKFNLSTWTIGLIFLIDPLTYMLTMLPCGFITDRVDIDMSIMLIGGLLGAICFLFLGPAPFLTFMPFKLWVVCVSLALSGVSAGCLYTPVFKYLLRNVKKDGLPDDLDVFGIVSGYVSFCQSTGALLGPIIGGAIVDAFGFEMGICFCSILCLTSSLAIVIRMLSERYSNRNKTTDKDGSSDITMNIIQENLS